LEYHHTSEDDQVQKISSRHEWSQSETHALTSNLAAEYAKIKLGIIINPVLARDHPPLILLLVYTFKPKGDVLVFQLSTAEQFVFFSMNHMQERALRDIHF